MDIDKAPDNPGNDALSEQLQQAQDDKTYADRIKALADLHTGNAKLIEAVVSLGPKKDKPFTTSTAIRK